MGAPALKNTTGDSDIDALLAEPAGTGDADIDALLAAPTPEAPKSHVIEMPEQRIEGELPKPSVLERLGSMLSGNTPIAPGIDHGPSMFSKQGLQNLRTGAPALLAGATHGATLGLADDAADLVSHDAGNAVRRYWDDAKQSEPGAFTVGDMGSTLALPTGLAGEGAGVLARAGGAALEGGAYTGARAFGDSEEVDPAKRAYEAIAAAKNAALEGGGISLGGSALGALGGKLSEKFAEKAGDITERQQGARLRSFGMEGGQIKKLKDWKKAELANTAEDIVERNGRLFPGTVKQFGEDAAADAEIAGAEKNNVADQLRAVGAEVDPSVAARKLEEEKARFAAGGSLGSQKRATIQAEADRMREMPHAYPLDDGALGPVKPTVPWDEMEKEVNAWGTRADPLAPPNETNEFRRDIYGSLMHGMQQEGNRAIPGVGDEWKELRARQGQGIQLSEAAQDFESKAAGNRQLSLTDTLAGGTGATVGAGAAAALGLPTLVGGAIGGAVGAGANQAWRTREHAIVASGLKNLQGGLQSASGAAATGGMLANAVGEQGSGLAKLGGMMAQRSTQEQAQQTRGYLTSDAALGLLRSDPQQLGAYTAQFAQAAASPDSRAVDALISKLSRTDPDFRANVLPKLQAQTSGDQ